MRYALAFLASLALAAPLTPLEGVPGEAVTLVFGGTGEVRLPQGFSFLLPPEPLDGVTVFSLRVPPLPPGEYPLGFGGETYPFRVLPLSKAFLQPLSSPELAFGEVGEAEVRVVNLGNVPLPLPPQVVGLEVEVLGATPSGSLPPGKEEVVRVRLRGKGKEGRLLLRLAGANAEARVPAKPAPLPPFYDWARLPSRLRWESRGGVALEGAGSLLDAEGRSLGRVAYRFAPSSGYLAYDLPEYGVSLALAPNLLALRGRYALLPGLALAGEADTGGRFRLSASYRDGGLSLGGHLGYPWDYGLDLAYGFNRGGERFSLSGNLRPGGWGAGVGYGREGFNLGLSYGEPQGGYLQGVASLGGGYNLGLGLRFSREVALVGLVGVPFLGTVELRGEYALGSGSLRLYAFHVLRDPESAFQEELSWSEVGLTYRLSAHTHLPTELGPARVGAEARLAPGRLGLGGSLDLAPFSLQASLDLGPRGWEGFALSGAVAFDLPLYPLAWPTLGLEALGEPPQSLAVAGPQGTYLLPLGPKGVGALRLPPGRYRVLAPKGFGFLTEEGVVAEVPVELRGEGRSLRVRIVPARALALSLRYCPPEARPGYTFGLPGVSPEEVLRRTRVLLAGPIALSLGAGEAGRIPPGRYALRLQGPYASAVRLLDPQGRPLEEVEVASDGLLEACLTFPLRPVEEQEVR